MHRIAIVFKITFGFIYGYVPLWQDAADPDCHSSIKAFANALKVDLSLEKNVEEESIPLDDATHEKTVTYWKIDQI